MIYIFDANSILTLTREIGEKVVDVVRGNVTADLAFYEIGNALWKECHLHQRLSAKEAAKTLNFIRSLTGLMRVLDAKNSDFGERVLANALDLGITYYDSIYLTIAEKIKGTLVTDDEKLLDASRKKIAAISTTEFIKIT